MAIVHIVLFHFKPTLSRTQLSEASERMLALASQCKHPRTGAPYIKSYGGGRNISPEGLSKGATHGFVFEFDTVEERDYYLDTDPIHVAFKDFVLPLVDDATVLDFAPGQH